MKHASLPTQVFPKKSSACIFCSIPPSNKPRLIFRICLRKAFIHNLLKIQSTILMRIMRINHSAMQAHNRARMIGNRLFICKGFFKHPTSRSKKSHACLNIFQIQLLLVKKNISIHQTKEYI